MAVQTHPKPAAALAQHPALRVLESRRRGAQLHLFTYVVGNALFWTLWAAIWVTADRWYWWPIIPLAGWALVLATHLWHVYYRSQPPTHGTTDDVRGDATADQSHATHRFAPDEAMSAYDAFRRRRDHGRVQGRARERQSNRPRAANDGRSGHALRRRHGHRDNTHQ